MKILLFKKTFPESDWLTGNHSYCRNPAWEEAREFCYVNQTHKGFCAVRTCGNQWLHKTVMIRS